MEENKNNGGHAAAGRRRRGLVARVWSLLPALFFIGLIAVIVLLMGRIKSESLQVEQVKKSRYKIEENIVNVVTYQLAPMPLRDRISLPGVVMPWLEMDVLPEVRGRVIEKRVEKGRTVEKGTVLAVLDSRDYRNTLKSARASYNAALSEYRRLERLHKEQLASKSRLEAAQAQLQGLQAQMDSAALNVERCTLTAPIDGIVNFLNLDQGRYVNVGEKVAEILQIDKVKVGVGIPESDVDAVRRLDEFTVTIDALDGAAFSGRKDFLSRTADSAARLYNLEITLENPDYLILPDMFARVEIVKREVVDGLAIPLYVVINREGRHFVYVVEDNKARLQPVELGIQDGWLIQVVKGLTPGQPVIAVGQRSVADGQTVKVIRTATDIKDLVS